MKILTGRNSYGGVKGGIGIYRYQFYLSVLMRRNDFSYDKYLEAVKDTVRSFIIFRNIKNTKRQITIKIYY
jgi:hypothetical protein